MTSFGAFFRHVCDDPCHLTQKCALLVQDSLSQLAIICSKKMHKLTGGKRSKVGRELFVASSATFKVTDAEDHRHYTRIPRYLRHKKTLLLIEKT